ncbi:PREDICTED: uncharacterized protein LOC105555887 [Vollenhovia emeryi]|uniref:uncharacterized protein LOC105555887 n=1 Tax=Vollenhovia emeryi TaxID=411798 RepID=UPI0005F49265|nr:PREDICTED: uncharacterized protein LOC105555887 [Vollenhovia emeryi]
MDASGHSGPLAEEARFAAECKLCPASCEPRFDLEFLAGAWRRRATRPVSNFLDAPFTMEELESALEYLEGRKSAPGIDQVDFPTICSFPSYLRRALLDIFNGLLLKRSPPAEWKRAMVVLIPKGGSKGLRPISLLSCYLKVLERIIYLRLMWYVESNNIIPNEQFGFRRARSCGDSLSILSGEVKNFMLKGDKVSAVFLDIVSAFDNVDPLLLVEGLIDIGVPDKLSYFIYELLKKRRIQFLCDGEMSDVFFSYKGTPQDSILSPLLFNIYLRNLPANLAAGIKALQYADDLVIWGGGSDVQGVIDSLSSAVNRVDSFLGGLGLSLSAAKSQIIHFSRGGHASPCSPVLLGVEPIRQVEQARFLGIILDSRLSGGPHIEGVTRKCRAICNVITSLAGVWWGAHPSTLLTLYRSTLRSVMEYGHQVFFTRGNSSRLIKLYRIQYKAIRTAMGYRLSTPINTMFDEAREPPFMRRLDFSNSRFIYKNVANSESLVINSLADIAESTSSIIKRVWLLDNLPSFRAYIKCREDGGSIRRSPSLPYFETRYESLINNLLFHRLDIPAPLGKREATLLFKEISAEYRAGALTFYTDGSKSETGAMVGVGIFSPEIDIGISKRIPREASIFTAEAWAIMTALDIARERGGRFCRITIFSDSKSVLEAVCSFNPFPANFLISKIREQIYLFKSSGITVNLVWVPAHRGIPGNEMADALAKRAIVTGGEVSPGCLLPYTDFLAESRSDLRNSSENYFKICSVSKGALNFEKFHNTSPKPWFHKVRLKRDLVVLINRLRSNHYNLNHSLFRKNIVSSPNCICGFDTQDLNHVIFDCPSFCTKMQNLNSYLRSTFADSLGSPPDLLNLLHDPCHKLCRLLLAAFKSAEMLP